MTVLWLASRHCCSILRKQEYVEDPSLTTPEAVTQSILYSNSLGWYVQRNNSLWLRGMVWLLRLAYLATRCWLALLTPRDSLTDLRFRLLEEMLAAAPTDACTCLASIAILLL